MNSYRELADNSNISHFQLAQAALERYALEGATLTLVSEAESALYQVSLPSSGPAILHPYLGCVNGQTLILRIEDSADDRITSTYSELTILATLLRDTDMEVPEPVPTCSGELVPELWVEGMLQPRQCVLFRWAGAPFPDRFLRRASRWQDN